ncbi:phage FluMu protein Com [Mucilaginibacter sp. UYNi724]
MIIYGTRSKIIKTEYIAEPCPNCNTLNSMQMNIAQKWAHIFWIPFFPIGKTGVSQCTHCQQVLALKNMTPMLKLSYENMRSDTKIPLWTFSGIAVIIAISIFVVIHEKQNADRITKMIPTLQKNDVLHLKLANNAYSLSKVTGIHGDSVFFVNNKFQTDVETGLDDLKNKKYDTEERFFTISEIKDLYKKDELLDIDRK